MGMITEMSVHYNLVDTCHIELWFIAHSVVMWSVGDIHVDRKVIVMWR